MQHFLRSGTAVLLTLALAVQASTAQTTRPSDLPSAAAGETEDLQLYAMPTQIGTVARRTIRDGSGRVAREVFYSSNSFARVPQTGQGLVVQSIRVYYYDGAGRVDRVEHWGQDLRVEHNAYSPSGELVRKWFVDADGVRRYEMRFKGSTTMTRLYFDDTGTYLRSVRGQLVGDVDLPHGWGMPSGGMACGITVSTERGRFDDIGVWVNIKNVSSETVLHIDTLIEPSFELRDDEGKVISPRQRGREFDRKPKERHAQLYGQLLRSGAAGFMYPAYRLADYFGLLSPGKYTIRVCQPLPGRDGCLISNGVTFVVVH